METNQLLPRPNPADQYVYAYSVGARFGWIKRYGWYRMSRALFIAVVLLFCAAAVFVTGYDQKPRGTGEVMQMTLGTAALAILRLDSLGFIGTVRLRNSNRAAPAGWYPDPFGVRRLRWFNGTGRTGYYHPAG